MKKASEILKMPILCIGEGLELGNAAGMIINPDAAKVEYLILDDGEWYNGIKVLPFAKILSIGNDVITTNTANNINIPGEGDFAILKGEVRLTGTRVFNEKGKYLGVIEDYSIDEDSGKLVQFVLDDGDSVIEGAEFITLGKAITVVGSGTASKGFSSFKATPEKTEDSADSVNTSFDEKQKDFLLGRTSTKTIVSKGKVIVKEGSVIDESIINAVTAAGKITELITNTKA